MKFSSLKINGWRQYDTIDIQFHEKLTILTGANSSGKTTLLNLLGRHFNWHTNLLATGKRDQRGQFRLFQSGVLESKLKRFSFTLPPTMFPPGYTPPEMDEVGVLAYDNGTAVPLQIPREVGIQYGINIPNQQNVYGIFIPSHRPVYTYASVDSLPTQGITKENAYNQYTNITQQRYFGGGNIVPPTKSIKESLIAFALFGFGNEVVAPNMEARKAFQDFQEILRITLPPKIGFERLRVRMPELMMETRTGDFAIDAVSGGVASIIDIAWRIFTYPSKNEGFVCIIDEPENHLHPELQQTLLADMMDAFPMVQFIVATHSPFMITSTDRSYVYVLDYNDENLVDSSLLETVNKAATANETLKNVLGLPFTMPLWAEKKFDAIVKKYTDSGVDDNNVAQLEAELQAAGLGEYVPPQREESQSQQ